MIKTSHGLLVGSCVLVLLGGGCASSQPPTAPQSKTATPTPAQPSSQAPATTPPVAATTGNCDNPYFPLKQGTKISYSTQASGKTSNYSLEVTSASNNAATVTYTFSPKVTVNLDLTCDTSGISAKTFVNLGTTIPGGQVTEKTTGASGQYLPADLHTGSVWSNSYTVDVDTTVPEAVHMGMQTAHMTVDTSDTALGEESVTVPAGTFTAMKVERKMTTHMVISPSIPPMDTQETTDEYFVTGKGLVKSETTLPNNGGTTVTEATSIVTP